MCQVVLRSLQSSCLSHNVITWWLWVCFIFYCLLLSLKQQFITSVRLIPEKSSFFLLCKVLWCRPGFFSFFLFFAPLISCFIDPVIIYLALKFNPTTISDFAAHPFLKLDVFKVSAAKWTEVQWGDLMNRLDTSSTSDSFVPEDGTASSRCSFGGVSSIVLLHIASFCRSAQTCYLFIPGLP